MRKLPSLRQLRLELEEYIFVTWKGVLFGNRLQSRFLTRQTQLTYTEYWWIQRYKNNQERAALRARIREWQHSLLAQLAQRLRDTSTYLQQKAVDLREGYRSGGGIQQNHDHELLVGPPETTGKAAAAAPSEGEWVDEFRQLGATTTEAANKIATAVGTIAGSPQAREQAIDFVKSAGQKVGTSPHVKQGMSNLLYLKETGQVLAERAVPKTKDVIQNFLTGYRQGIEDSATANSPLDNLSRVFTRIASKKKGLD